MTVFVPLTGDMPPASSSEDAGDALFAAAKDRFDMWRGRCLDALTLGETAINEFLLHLPDPLTRQGSLPPLVGQRYAMLEALFAEGGPLAEGNAGVRKAIERFGKHHHLRILLCHGLSRVAIERHGGWIALLTVPPSRRDRPPEPSVFIEEDADARRQELYSVCQSLRDRLRRLRHPTPGA